MDLIILLAVGIGGIFLIRFIGLRMLLRLKKKNEHEAKLLVDAAYELGHDDITFETGYRDWHIESKANEPRTRAMRHDLYKAYLTGTQDALADAYSRLEGIEITEEDRRTINRLKRELDDFLSKPLPENIRDATGTGS